MLTIYKHEHLSAAGDSWYKFFFLWTLTSLCISLLETIKSPYPLLIMYTSTNSPIAVRKKNWNLFSCTCHVSCIPPRIAVLLLAKVELVFYVDHIRHPQRFYCCWKGNWKLFIMHATTISLITVWNNKVCLHMHHHNHFHYNLKHLKASYHVHHHIYCNTI